VKPFSLQDPPHDDLAGGLREKIVKGPRKMIGNTGYRRYVTVDRDAVHIDEKKIGAEEKFDGAYVLRNNTERSFALSEGRRN
jgi:hypothetical protein